MDHCKKVLTYKTYNKIGHFSKSRLGDGDHFVDPKTEKICLSQVEDGQTLIIVQEKLDGSNVCVVNIEGKLVALSRSGYRCDESNLEQHRCFAKWVELNYCDIIKSIPIHGMRIVGEWLMQAHGTTYNLYQYSPFIPFDIFTPENIRVNYRDFLQHVLPNKFCIPVVLHMGGACSLNRAQRIASDLLKPGRLHHIIDGYEGFVYRIEKSGVVNNIIKYVRHDKVDGKYFKEHADPVWNISPDEIEIFKLGCNLNIPKAPYFLNI